MSDLIHGLEPFPVTDLLVKKLIQIQAQHLRLFTDAQVHAGDVLENEQQDARHDEGVSGDGGDLSKLLADLHAVAVDSAGRFGRAVEHADGLVGEDARQERAHHAADAVQFEDVEALVDLEPFVQVLEGGADHGCQEADDRCEPERDVAGGGCDADQTGDGSLAGSDDGETAFGADVVDEHPADRTGGGSDVGVEGSVPGDGS